VSGFKELTAGLKYGVKIGLWVFLLLLVLFGIPSAMGGLGFCCFRMPFVTAPEITIEGTHFQPFKYQTLFNLRFILIPLGILGEIGLFILWIGLILAATRQLISVIKKSPKSVKSA